MTYKVKPAQQHLQSVYDYFFDLANKQVNYLKKYGLVEFRQKDILDEDEIGINTSSYLSGVMGYLKDNGLAVRLRKGTPHSPSLWDVSKFLEYGTDSIKGTVDKREVSFKVEVVKQNEDSTPPVKEVQEPSNEEVMKELNSNITDMMGYLQQLPLDIIGELRNVSDKLKLVDANELEVLKKEKEDLKNEVSQLKEELVNTATVNYSEHYIVRQKNLVLDEVDRILSRPAWQVKQNKEHYQKAIQEKMDNILSHLDIKEEE